MIPILNPLIPAKAGTQIVKRSVQGVSIASINLFIVSLMIWVPAFAGMSGSWG
jgi:hypothetical protein